MQLFCWLTNLTVLNECKLDPMLSYFMVLDIQSNLLKCN